MKVKNKMVQTPKGTLETARTISIYSFRWSKPKSDGHIADAHPGPSMPGGFLPIELLGILTASSHNM
jgi:hypothetical protein